MARPDLTAVTGWITSAALRDGARLPETLMERLAIGRRAALALLARLVAAQWLVREGSARRPVWRPGVLRQVVHRYALAGLQEDLPWQRDFAPCFELRPNVARLAQQAFTELLNNAIDHSGGTLATVSVRQTALHLQILVSDDGCGVFERIARHFAIDDPRLAMLELSKGKLTSQPAGHRGHGLFFTARLADMFDVHANGHAFQFRGAGLRRWHAARPLKHEGTSAYAAIALDTERTVDAVLRSHSAEPDGYAFDTTQVTLGLLAGPATGLESRAQARRVAQGLTRFRRAELDFSGLDDVGHAFADELFRVFARDEPGVQLVPLAMAPRVAAMVAAVQAAG